MLSLGSFKTGAILLVNVLLNLWSCTVVYLGSLLSVNMCFVCA